MKKTLILIVCLAVLAIAQEPSVRVMGGWLTIAAGVNPQVGASYALQATDNGKVVTLSNAAAITLTVPADLGAGFNCLIVQLGAGKVTPTASGTTINQRLGYTKTAGQYAVATLVSYAANTFVLSGDLE